MCTREFVGLVSFGLGEGLVSLDVLDEAHGEILDVQTVERIVGLAPLARMLAVTALAVLFQQIDHNVHGLVGRFAALQAQPQEVHTQQAIAPLQRFFRKHRLVADRHAVFVDALLVAERPPDL